MVSSQSSSRSSPSSPANLGSRRRGHCMMTVAVLLFLYMPVTTAVAVRHSLRPQTDPLSLINSLQTAEEFVTSVDRHKGTPSTATNSRTTEVPTPLRNILIKSIRARSRRAVQRGCQFGTCQVHNLANTLYMMGQKTGKEQSKKATDPNGYGR
uniref:Uncharacterized protein n=1 Tax=Pygocentrus nattereri TaxID=42514 RepID=A0A3B4ECE4_PYGNA